MALEKKIRNYYLFHIFTLVCSFVIPTSKATVPAVIAKKILTNVLKIR